jgi:hypothetical protein
METKSLFNRTSVMVILIAQFIPILLLPPKSFDLSSQEWWLPVLLVIFEIIAVVQLFRHNEASWPWDLIGFAQGFNIISRIMLIMPHSITDSGSFDTLYVVLSLVSMLLSTFMLWYIAKPEVRNFAFTSGSSR